MAFQVDHKIEVPYDAVGRNDATIITTLYNYMMADARFYIAGSSITGLSGCWFVFGMTGHPWQCWVGAGGNAAPGWHADNIVTGVAYGTNWDFFGYAFSPSGGWAVTDTPMTSGLMFSNAVSAGWWCKIRRGTYQEFTFQPNWLTIVSDAVSGAFILLFDDTCRSTWMDSLFLLPIESPCPDQDPYAYVAFAGYYIYFSTTSPYALFTHGVDSSFGACLKPGSNVQGIPSVDGTLSYLGPSEGQPNQITGLYDLQPFYVTCNTVGIAHFKGMVEPRAVRQGPSAFFERQVLGQNPNCWMVAGGGTAGAVCIPWDSTVIP